MLWKFLAPFAALLAIPLSASDERVVSVLYAGSLGAVMENGIGPAFSQATGYHYQGEAQGSLGAAHMIRDRLRAPDVFISADTSINETVLMGPRNGNQVTWFANLASSQLVFAYNPKSKFATELERVAANKVPWFEFLGSPGVRFGRGDPTVDPKGYRTLFLFNLAGAYYHRTEIPGLLGDPVNPKQVFPETVLMAKVESGQLDAGIFYKHEVIAHKLPYISLPHEINQGDPKFATQYAAQSYVTASGERIIGAPIIFTIAIPATVRHREGALAFVQFMLSSGDLLEHFGLSKVEHRVRGDESRVPVELRSLLSGASTP